MFCKYCGKEYEEGTRYCSSCGGDLSEGANPVTPGTGNGKDITINSATLTKVLGAVFTLIFVFYFFKNFLNGMDSLLNLGRILRIDAGYAFVCIIIAIFTILLAVISVLLAFTAVLIFKYTEKEKLLNIFAVSGILGGASIGVVILRAIVAICGKINPVSGAIIVYLLFIVAFVGSLFGILNYVGEQPMNVFNDLKGALNEVIKMVRELGGNSNKPQEVTPNRAGATNQGVTPNRAGVSNQAAAPNMQQPSAAGINEYGMGNVQGGVPMIQYVKQDRSLLTYILLSIVTCVIYPLIFFHNLAKDMNIVCAGDGENTAGLAKFILLTIVTCGIYAWIWYYSLGNRIARNAPRYGITIVENGTSVLLWFLFGSLLCGIGPLVGMHIIIKNSNLLCQAYNAYVAQNTYQ